jgi:hypothetical protein
MICTSLANGAGKMFSKKQGKHTAAGQGLQLRTKVHIWRSQGFDKISPALI